jgi:AraC-like DNA-binding protein
MQRIAMLEGIDLSSIVPCAQWKLHQCSSMIDLARVLRREVITGVIAGPRDGAGRRLEDVILSCESVLLDVPVVIYASLTPGVTEAVLDLGRRGMNVRVAVDGYHTVRDALSGFGGGAVYWEAQHEILGAFPNAVPASVRPILIGAVAVGWGRPTVRFLAKVVCMSPRTIERRLAEALSLPACRLLAWMNILYSMWHAEAHEWTLKRISAASGFASPEAFMNHLRRHTGRSLGELRLQGGFKILLSELRDALSSAPGCNSNSSAVVDAKGECLALR